MAVDILCTLEAPGLCRGDGKRPDGISIIPWVRGRCLVWDATCHDTFALTNISTTSNGAGLIADWAASGKRILYSDLCQSYVSIPIAVESSGSIGKDALEFLHELGRRMRCKIEDPQSYYKPYKWNFTAQKGKGDREKRTSDRARTRDLRSIVEFQPREPRRPAEILRPPSPLCTGHRAVKFHLYGL